MISAFETQMLLLLGVVAIALVAAAVLIRSDKWSNGLYLSGLALTVVIAIWVLSRMVAVAVTINTWQAG